MTLTRSPLSPRSAFGRAPSPAPAGLSSPLLSYLPSGSAPAASRPAPRRAGAPVLPPLTGWHRPRRLLACGT